MGSDQSTQLPAGAPGSTLKSQRDEEIPYTSFSISKPINGDSPRQSPRIPTKNKVKDEKDTSKQPKHDIVVVKDGTQYIKDPDPELTKLNTIPVFYPIMRGSLNVPISARDGEMLDKMDHQKLLDLCLRYQDHLKQLSEAVAFDQNALCVRIKEIDCAMHMLLNLMNEKQKKFHKYAEQFQRVSETVTTLNKIKNSMDNLIPKMESLNELLPPEDRLESFDWTSSPGTSTK